MAKLNGSMGGSLLVGVLVPYSLSGPACHYDVHVWKNYIDVSRDRCIQSYNMGPFPSH